MEDTRETTDQSTGQDGTGEGTAEQQGLTEAERQEQERQRTLDRYRNEAGQAAKKARELEAELQRMRDEKLSDTERLQKTAEKVPVLEQERDSYKSRAEAAEAVLAEEVEARKKVLPKELAALLPEGTPGQQLAWIRQAQEAAEKLKPSSALPPAGGRNPGAGNGKQEPSDQDRAQAARHYGSHF